MRIDLHIHTQKCKQGDGSKRNITPEKFIEKMNKNNVKICAITNHNKFDFEEFKKIRELEPELTIFPGIELDINFKNNERKHIILICNPDSAKKFYNIFDNDCNRNYDEFFLNYNELLDKIERFSEDEIIIIPHFGDKDKKTALKKEDKEKLEKDLSKYIIILEPKLRTMGIINAHNEIALVGSDIKDWNNYIKDNLPEIKFKIDSFRKFYELASDTTNFIKNFLSGTLKEKIKFKNNEDYSEIEIYNDINVIFGEKGSGKTVLIKEINNELRNIGKKVFFHEGKDYEEKYNGIKDEYEKEIEIDENKKNYLENLLNSIITYTEEKPENFVKKYKDYYQDKTSNKKSKNIKKIETNFLENISENLDELIRKGKTQVETILQTKMINNEIRKSNSEIKEELNNKLELLQQDIYLHIIAKYKEIFNITNVENILNVLKSSVQKKTGKVSRPTNIGFSKLISERTKRICDNFEFIEKLQSMKKEQKKKIGNLPNKGEVFLETKILILTENTTYYKGSKFDRSKIRVNKENIKKINNFLYKDLKKINGYFGNEINPKEFLNDIIKKDSIVTINEKEYTPSEGEKAILSISGLLENYSYDCYLFDEVERGLGNKYISEYLIPQLKKIREKGKIIVLSTHNANIAINTLPSQSIYCNYPDKNNYYIGQMYSNELIGIENKEMKIWEEQALIHLEGSEKMFSQRRNIYGI